MNFILLHINHRHVSTTHVAIFRVVRIKLRSLIQINLLVFSLNFVQLINSLCMEHIKLKDLWFTQYNNGPEDQSL
jgi:hypothetical protein